VRKLLIPSVLELETTLLRVITFYMVWMNMDQLHSGSSAIDSRIHPSLNNLAPSLNTEPIPPEQVGTASDLLDYILHLRE